MNQAINQTNIAFFVEPTINRLYQVREEIRDLQKTEKELTADIIKFMETRRLNEIVAGKIKALLSSAKRYDVDPMLYRNRVNESQFMDTVTVSVTKARDFVCENDLEKISKITRFNQLRVSETQ